nr:MAG TPA: hypothetical protein [Caudoviricetes sp.]
MTVLRKTGGPSSMKGFLKMNLAISDVQYTLLRHQKQP